MARSYMHWWQRLSPCPINWFIQSAAQYTDPTQTMPIWQQMSMRWSYQCMHVARWMLYLYNWYTFEAINLFLYTYYSIISAKIEYFRQLNWYALLHQMNAELTQPFWHIHSLKSVQTANNYLNDKPELIWRRRCIRYGCQPMSLLVIRLNVADEDHFVLLTDVPLFRVLLVPWLWYLRRFLLIVSLHGICILGDILLPGSSYRMGFNER